MGNYPNFSKTMVLVIGDVMLDRYFWGDVERISPEAPVPVVRVLEKSEMPGGAGNVALNLSGLGVGCHLIGVCGEDEAGDFLVSFLTLKGITTTLLKIKGRSTTSKTRIIGRGQQLLRMDEEETGALSDKIYDDLFRVIDDSVEKAKAVIISDYGKGVFRHELAKKIIDRCSLDRIPVFVDPKGKDWHRYAGATCITPNNAEFKLVAPDMTESDASFEREARRVMDQYHFFPFTGHQRPQGNVPFSKKTESLSILHPMRGKYLTSPGRGIR